MPEFSHHIAWFHDVEDRLSRPEILTDQERRQMIDTCRQVLEQNAESAMAQGILARIQGITTDVRDSAATSAEGLEQKTARKIEEIEQGMAALQALLQSKLSLARTAQLQTALMNPFVFMEANRSNPLKNFEILKQQAASAGIPPEALALALKDPRHFAYCLVEKSALDEQGARIGNVPIRRSIALHEHYDLKRTINHFTVSHEIVHLMHQAMQRKNNLDAFLRFYARNDRPVIANEEDDAYGLQLEGMNVITNDRLRQEGRRGQIVSPDVLIKELQFDPSETIPMSFLGLMAREYFQGEGDVSAGRYPDRFKSLIRKACAHDGHAVCEYGQPGVPRP